MPAEARVAAATKLRGKHGAFLRDLLVEQFGYACTLAGTLAYDLAAIDRAMEWGYGWELGPFRAMDALGLDALRAAHLLERPEHLRAVEVEGEERVGRCAQTDGSHFR